MQRLTLGLVKDAVARILGVCATDPRVATAVNEAQERLLDQGDWAGTIVRYRICVAEGCLTWPRQIDTIEAWSTCCGPGLIRDQWFEFIGHGPGPMAYDSCPGHILVDRGWGPTFDFITGLTKKLRFYNDVAEASDAYVIAEGYDENGNWIRTQHEGEWINGERLSLASSGVISTKFFSSVTGLIFSQRNGTTRLYEYEPSTAIQKALGIYEHDETHPTYRKSLIPGLHLFTSSGDCTGHAVQVLAKLRHLPVSKDNDWLVLMNASAIKLMAQAIEKERKDLWDDAKRYEADAVRLLQAELSNAMGASVPAIRVQAASEWGGGGVGNYLLY